MNNSFKKNSVLFLFFVVYLSSCNEQLNQSYINPISSPTTKAYEAEYNWICENCGFWNGGWRDKCANCGKTCDEILSILTVRFAQEIENELTFSPYTEEQAKEAIERDPNLLELPTMLFAEHSPEPWFDSMDALRYYEEETNSILYTNQRYAEGVDIGWFKVSRILYPEYHDKNSVQILYDRFRLSEGRNWKTDFQLGIKAGVNAAVEAFLDY